jgi:2-polyprenyl-3-methyl-5-hydroxy-6-metoxy-1,4-benzoquinol methylase
LRLLDVGFGAGELARRVRERCSYLAGIELDAEAAGASAHFFDLCVARDLSESLETLGNAPFDVVVAGDVLEHLPDPGAVLDRLRPLVRKDGRLLVSLPNVANVTVRLSLLAGRFEYAPRGILDGTHVRFFTRKTGRRLLESHGFIVVSETATAMPVELAFPFLGRPPLAPAVRGGAIAAAHLLPGLFGYQFVWEAVRA